MEPVEHDKLEGETIDRFKYSIRPKWVIYNDKTIYLGYTLIGLNEILAY